MSKRNSAFSWYAKSAWKLRYILSASVVYYKILIYLHLKRTQRNKRQLKKISRSLLKKRNHVLAAAGAFTQFRINNNFLLANLISYLELLLVDIPDKIGDQLNYRSIPESRFLYSFSLSIFSEAQELPKSISGRIKRNIFIHDLLRSVTFKAKHWFENYLFFANPTLIPLIKNYAAEAVHRYAKCVEIMHIKDVPLRKKEAANYFYSEMSNNENNIPAWAQNVNVFYLCGGSPLGLFAVLLQGLTKKNNSAKTITAVHNYYKYTIPFLHVLFDDICDVYEDIVVQNDVNIFFELEKNRSYKDIKSNIDSITKQICLNIETKYNNLSKENG